MPDNSVKGLSYYAKANGSFGKGEQEKPPPVLAVTANPGTSAPPLLEEQSLLTLAEYLLARFFQS